MKPTTLAIIIAVLLIPIAALAVSSKQDKAKTTTASPSPTATNTPAVNKATDLKDPADAVSAKKVILSTSKGDITINLYPTDAPKTVMNFVTLGKRGYYNDIIFHRVIKAFVIQAGDPTGTGSGGESIYGSTFPDEINSHKIVKGSVAMANRGPNTNSSQFYIVTESAQTSLDGSYTNFGEVADDASMAVVTAIAASPTDQNDRPVDAIKITGFKIVE